MENKINRNLLIKVTEEQVYKVLEVLRNNGEKARKYFGYTENRWCYIGYYNLISEWTIAHDGSIDFGNKEISFEEFIKLTETQETTMENNRKIKYSDAQRIVDIACETWTEILFGKWGRDIVLKRDIEITDKDYQKMRGACTEAQHKLFDEIFGAQFKVGDWVIGQNPCRGARQVVNVSGGFLCFKEPDRYTFDYARLATEEEIKAANAFPDGTPCLVKDNKIAAWLLYYADGQGRFYIRGMKSGETVSWKYSMKLDINNLPVNE